MRREIIVVFILLLVPSLAAASNMKFPDMLPEVYTQQEKEKSASEWMMALEEEDRILVQKFLNNWDKPLSTTAKVLLATYYGLDILDLLQTLNIAKHPEKWHELNPLLGKHPTSGAVVTMFSMTAGGVYFLVKAMDDDYRTPLLIGLCLFKAGLVAHNFSTGIGINPF
jgi:hypothetical protein